MVTGLARREADPTAAEWRAAMRKLIGSEIFNDSQIATGGDDDNEEWDQNDKLYDHRKILSVSAWFTAAALEAMNGARALVAACFKIKLTNEQQWKRLHRGFNILEWGEIGPTGVPRGFSMYKFETGGHSGRYGAIMTVANVELCDPNYGPGVMEEIMEGFSQTGAATIEHRASHAVAMTAYRNYLDLIYRRNEGRITFNDQYEYFMARGDFGCASRGSAPFQAKLNLLCDQHPAKNVVVTAENTAYLFHNQMANSPAIRAYFADLIGNVFTADRQWAGLEAQPTGVLNKGMGSARGVTLVKCATQRHQPDAEVGVQPLTRELRLNYVHAFDVPKYDATDVACGPNRIYIGVLRVTADGANTERFSLEQVIRHTNCGGLFAGDGKSPSKKYKRALAEAQATLPDTKRLVVLSDPRSNIEPHEYAQASIQMATDYDSMKYWRDWPTLANENGDMAETVIGLTEQEVPSEMLYQMARCFIASVQATEHPAPRIIGATIGAALQRRFPGHAHPTIRDAGEGLPGEVPGAPGRAAVRGREGPVYTWEEARNAFEGTVNEAGGVVGVRGLLAHVAGPQHDALLVHVPTLAANAGLLQPLAERFQTTGDDVAKNAAYADGLLEKLAQVPTGRVLSNQECEALLRESMPKTEKLAAIKPQISARATDTVWAKARGIAALSDVALAARFREPAGLRHRPGTASLTRDGQLQRVLNRVGVAEFDVMVALGRLPLTVDTLANFAAAGIPLCSGYLMRGCIQLQADAVVAMDTNDAANNMYMSPVRLTITSRGAATRETDFASELMVGFDMIDSPALAELPAPILLGVRSGLGVHLSRTFEEFETSIKGTTPDVMRADMRFVPQAISHPRCQFRSDYLGRLERGENGIMAAFRKSAGAALDRRMLGTAAVTEYQRLLDGAAARYNGNFIFPFNPKMELAPAWYPVVQPNGAMGCRYEQGTGPLADPVFWHHQTAAKAFVCQLENIEPPMDLIV